MSLNPATEAAIKKKFARYSNQELVNRANGLPDFKWDDEGYEIQRRVNASEGKLIVKMEYNTLKIIKDEK